MQIPLLLIFHGSAGGIALLAGTAAVVVRKGSRAHALTGNVFTAGMLALGASGAALALLRSQRGNLFGGLLTLYLVTTAWTAGRSKNGRTGALDWIAMIFGLLVGSAIAGYGVIVALGRVSTDVPAGMDFFLAAVVLLAVAGDARMLYRGGITGRPRIVRHLWRMCFALFEASGSFFLGRAHLFPAAIQRSGLLIFLTVLPLLLLVIWVLRVRKKRPGREPFILRPTRARSRLGNV